MKLKRFFSLKRILIFLLVLALVALVVWFFFIRVTPTGKANELVDAMKEAKENYEKHQNTPEAYDAANECATAALAAKTYREELKSEGDLEGIKTFDAIYQPVAKEIIDIVIKEEIYDDEDEVNALFATD